MMNLYLVTVLLVLFQASPDQRLASIEARAKAGDVKAQVQLGLAYASGDGVAADEPEAVRWFRRAADQGDASGEYYLGEVYFSGRGVPVDYAEALKWLRKAADLGESHAQYNLAAMYALGLGLSRDEAESAKWMRKAADQGLAAGEFGLGSLYAHGNGVPQNENEAIKWYRKAAAQGDSPAMNNLAMLLATSIDPKIHDPNQAVLFAQKALEIQADNASYLDTLATAYFAAGQPVMAAEAERRALTLKPESLSYKKALEKYEAQSGSRQ